MREIATQMGVSVFTVHSDLKKVQQHRTAELDKRREEVAVKQDAIYESLLDKWIPVALAEQGDVEEQLYATDRVARILADQAKLHGYTVTARDTAAAKQAGHELGMTVLQAMAALAGGSRVVQAEVITQPRIEDGKRD
jgi:cytidylate kinase